MERQKLFMNPVSNSIIQFVLKNGTATTSEIAEYYEDVSKSTLYRYIKELTQHKVLKVVKEEKIRGQIQRTYGVHRLGISQEEQTGNSMAYIENYLRNIYMQYDIYFEKGNVNPQEDYLFAQVTSLMLSDKEYEELIDKIKKVLKQYIGKKRNEQRKVRNLYMMSAPECREEKDL